MSVFVNTYDMTSEKANANHEAPYIVSPPNYHDDGGFSEKIRLSNISGNDITDGGNIMSSIFHSANIYTDAEIRSKLYTENFRFGLRDRSGTLGTGREYLFFTKPDLHIYQVTNDTGMGLTPSSNLVTGLQDIPFWEELNKYNKNTTLATLQMGASADKFNHLLQNMVKSNLDIPSLTSDTVETATNMYGVGYSYRGTSEASDDNPTFSLEFRDTRYLDVYKFFKAYEEYETLKHHGLVSPQMYYRVNKIIHDQFAIFKFVVGDDMETIIYYGKMYGVMPLSLPRDAFSNPTFDDGISYSIDFKAAFYEDMRPDILTDFNTLSATMYNGSKYQINPYNEILDKGDMRTARAAAVIKDTTSGAAKASPTGYVYKLKWRGGAQV